MHVKRTKKGYSIALGFEERESLFRAFTIFFMNNAEAMNRARMETEREVMFHLYHNILSEVMLKLNFQLFLKQEVKYRLSRPECIAVMWMLRNHDSEILLLEIKCSLHKSLHVI